MIVLWILSSVALLFVFFPLRWDKIVRRTAKAYRLGGVVKGEDGLWYKVVKVSPSEAPFDGFFRDRRNDVLLRRLRPREASVYEVMES